MGESWGVGRTPSCKRIKGIVSWSLQVLRPMLGYLNPLPPLSFSCSLVRTLSLSLTHNTIPQGCIRPNSIECFFFPYSDICNSSHIRPDEPIVHINDPGADDARIVTFSLWRDDKLFYHDLIDFIENYPEKYRYKGVRCCVVRCGFLYSSLDPMVEDQLRVVYMANAARYPQVR